MPRDDPTTEEERRAHSATDLMRIRIERLQQNIQKPIIIPTQKEALRPPKPPLEFVRNVVGSSAAAGSAEFHIYRNNRRKEQNRQDYINAVAKKEDADAEFKAKAEIIRKNEEIKTAKRRAKRLKKKEAAKKRRKLKEKNNESDEDESDTKSEESDTNSEEEEGETNKNNPGENPE